MLIYIGLLFFSSAVNGINIYGCLLKLDLCHSLNQLCVDDGFIGECISKRQSRNSERGIKRSDTVNHHQATEDLYRHLPAGKRERLEAIVYKVKKVLHSRNIELSSLSPSEINRLATAIAQVFLQQEKDVKAKKITLLESFLRKLGRNNLANLAASNRFRELEKRLFANTSGANLFASFRSEEEETFYKCTSENVGDLLRNDPVKNEKDESLGSMPLDRKPTITAAFDEAVGNVKNPERNLQVADGPQIALADGNQMNTGDNNTRNVFASAQDFRDADNRASEIVSDGRFESENAADTRKGIAFADKPRRKASSSSGNRHKEATYIIVIVVLVVLVVCIVAIIVAVYCMKSAQARNKLLGVASVQSDDDYQALCRQHYASKANENPESKQPLIQKESTSSAKHLLQHTTRNSSLSSWSEEPITTTLDISTGHTVLAYMEDHLHNKDRLDKEWQALCGYRADNVTTKVAEENTPRNRSPYAVPYDHNRVKLNKQESAPMESDYINASYIIDNDPRWPLYIATQGPLSSTVHHFWQMIWEQGCVVIVMLTPLMEESMSQCARYWPDEGSSTYNDYEIHLVSEHIWCEDYLVRSLYLKNLKTGETRTVTQFHFLSWPVDGVPSSTKHLLELRRKVSKCYRGNALSPIVVHCSDGCGRTGSYMLLDLVISRMVKGTCKEIDIAATLEHLRDQRAGKLVATKEQLEFSLACVADEVNAILRVLLG